MKQILFDNKYKKIVLEEVPVPMLRKGGFLINVVSSLLSGGTEKYIVDLGKRNIIEQGKDNPALLEKVLNSVKTVGIKNTINKINERLTSFNQLGYSCSGIIIDKDPSIIDFDIGDRVACGGAGYANHAEIIYVPKNICVKLPEKLDFEEGAFVAIGSIALQGVRQSEAMLGEIVVVIGLGLLGNITMQLLKANGSNVIGCDVDDYKTHYINEMHMKAVNNKDILEEVLKVTNGLGADKIIITASSKTNDPINLASALARKKGKIIVVGNVGMTIPRDIFYEKELELIMSTSYGPGRYDNNYEEKGIDYPYPYVRWTENRNMQLFLSLIEEKCIDVKNLITHKYNLVDYSLAYDLLESNDKYYGIIINYENRQLKVLNKLIIDNKSFNEAKNDFIKIGLIGSGGFTTQVLLPSLSKNRNIQLYALATTTGNKAKELSRRYKLSYITTNYKDIMSDSNIDLIIIATRHDQHAPMVIEAFNAGRDVYVEKPLAINYQQLDKLIENYKKSKSRLTIGFNRRYSPLVHKIKEFFASSKTPLVINYRINAGFINKESWIQEIDIGGGRLIGEGCHFIDLLIYLADSSPMKLLTLSINNKDNNNGYLNNDNISIQMKFKNGTIGNIIYTALGNLGQSKEYLEVYGDGAIAILDDYRKLELLKNGKKNIIKSNIQNKGFDEQIKSIVASLKNGVNFIIDFKQAILTTKTTLKAFESLMGEKIVYFDD